MVFASTHAPSAQRPRNGREKVAILLLALGEKLGTQLLQKFDSAEVKAIMNSAASLGRVEKQDLDHLVDDFAANFARALGTGADFDSVKSMVERAFSPGDLSRMLGSQVMQAGEPAWKRFESGMENTLVPYLLDEHPQTIAFILSKLDPEFAARCLSILPGDFRITVARRLLKVQIVEGPVQDMVESVLEQDLLAKAGKLSQEARLAVFDKLQHDQVVTALRGMDAALKEVALSSLGARARRMVETELLNDKGVRTKEGDAARSAIVAQVLDMVQRGDIALPEDDATPA